MGGGGLPWVPFVLSLPEFMVFEILGKTLRGGKQALASANPLDERALAHMPLRLGAAAT